MKRSIEFYKETLGLELKSESPQWSEFELGGATVALHGGGKVPNEKSKDSNLAGSCSLGFMVEDLDDAFQELSAKGVSFVMPPTEREGEGIKLAVCLDPDGLAISLAQY